MPVRDISRRHVVPAEIVGIPGGLRLRLRCAGRAGPVVLLECGQGCGLDAWGYVEPQVARFTRVCAFDRAGSGWSDAPRALPRDARTLGTELHSLLDTADIARPIIYVAHSAASFNALVYTGLYPAEVAGIVFVEGSHPDEMTSATAAQFESAQRVQTLVSTCSTLAGTGLPHALGTLGLSSTVPHIGGYPGETRESAAAAGYRDGYCEGVLHEMQAFERSANQARAVRLAPQLPIVAITGARNQADGPPPASDLDRALAKLSLNGLHVISKRAGHYVQLDDPEIVVSAIRAVVDAHQRGVAVQLP